MLNSYGLYELAAAPFIYIHMTARTFLSCLYEKSVYSVLGTGFVHDNAMLIEYFSIVTDAS